MSRRQGEISRWMIMCRIVVETFMSFAVTVLPVSIFITFRSRTLLKFMKLKQVTMAASVAWNRVLRKDVRAPTAGKKIFQSMRPASAEINFLPQTLRSCRKRGTFLILSVQ